MPEKQSLRLERPNFRILLIIAAVVCTMLMLFCIPEVNTAVHLPICRFLYDRYRDTLSAELPAMQTCADEGWYYLAPMERSAKILQSEVGPAAVLRVSSYGDLYRHSYDYGLLWVEDADALLARNSGLTLYPLPDDGWYVYALITPQ